MWYVIIAAVTRLLLIPDFKRYWNDGLLLTHILRLEHPEHWQTRVPAGDRPYSKLLREKGIAGVIKQQGIRKIKCGTPKKSMKVAIINGKQKTGSTISFNEILKGDRSTLLPNARSIISLPTIILSTPPE